MKFFLNDSWNVNINNDTFKTDVPASVLSLLIKNGILEDPYFGLNEPKVIPFLEKDYTFYKSFNFNKSLYKYNRLVFKGLDTIVNCYLNDHLILEADDMHRTYIIDLNNDLLKDENTLRLEFKSAINYVREKDKNPGLNKGLSQGKMNFPLIRKNASSFGWDWGPFMPDMGIFRDIYIESSNDKFLDSVRTKFRFRDKVNAILSVNLSFDKEEYGEFTYKLYNPSGKLIEQNTLKSSKKDDTFHIELKNPKLWYPNGYGDQPLYRLVILDSNSDKEYLFDQKLGFREVLVDDSIDEIGRNLCVYINGKRIWLKGSNFIPMDQIIPNENNKDMKRLLTLTKDFNQNTIRVWGGGFYPSDEFFNYCDELGLLVMLDLMFACATYDSSDKKFMENIKEETKDNLRRLRNHPSLIMIDGNNECEDAVNWHEEGTDLEPYKKSYLEIFEELLREVVEDECDQYYLSSSPSSGAPFEKHAQDDRYLDCHNWEVWHRRKPIEAYKEKTPRLLSEFGLQSYPSMNMINEYTSEEDRKFGSDVLLMHQKNNVGNEIIHDYILKKFNEPTTFKSLVYLSQVDQVMAVKYAVDHLKIRKDRTNGAIYWQLNDCWGVQSWSSIDYRFNLKPLHYESRKFFSDNTLVFDRTDDKLSLYLTSDTDNKANYTVLLEYKNIDGTTYSSNIIKLKNSPEWHVLVKEMSIKKPKAKTNTYYKATLYSDARSLYQEYYFLNEPKELELEKAKITIKENGDRYIIKADKFVYGFFIEMLDPSVILSNNFFNIEKNEEVIVYANKNLKGLKYRTYNLKEVYEN